ncbi:MAG: preprotein translocase subunit SecE [Gammaproteobacteria bacterium]
MNTKIDTVMVSTRVDTVKIVVALLLVLSATAVFYIYPELPLLVRVLAIVGALILAAVIGLQTEKGRYIWSFFKDTQIEVRKVVWPTREETVQTTLVVVLMVIFVALFLWLLDLFLGWLIGVMMGHGG